MRTQRARHTRGRTRLLALLVVLGGLWSGAVMWVWTQTALLLSASAPIGLSLAVARSATWRLIGRGAWGDPAVAYPAAIRSELPGGVAFIAAAVLLAAVLAGAMWSVVRRVRRWGAGSPLGLEQAGLRRRAMERGWVRPRTWASPDDLRRLWVLAPTSGRPYLGWTGRAPARMLAAEVEVQPLVVAPPRAGKSSGFVIPWLCDHDGPALVLSTKRDVYNATVGHRERLGRVWVYDPFGSEASAGFTPLVAAREWSDALRTSEALAGAAHGDQNSAASQWWDQEAATLIAPLLHAAALEGEAMDCVLRWLDTRNFDDAKQSLLAAGVRQAWEVLDGVGRRDVRNRETTVMSAVNLLRAYRYPQVSRHAYADITPAAFLDGAANTIYVVASENDQRVLRPAILALAGAIYEAAIDKARRFGPLRPRLFLLLDEAANIAPIRDLAAWLSQCGDHGVLVATIWQSIAQIDHRYGRPARDAILAATTAQLFLPPLADPTTTGYLNGLLGEEPVAQQSRQRGGGPGTLSVAHRPVASAPWLREIERGRALLIYRDLPPAAVRTPGWFEDPRFTSHTATGASPDRHGAAREILWPHATSWGHKQ
jgi:type IV secretory pathway TraG/TraD family ATPase VirD4